MKRSDVRRLGADDERQVRYLLNLAERRGGGWGSSEVEVLLNAVPDLLAEIEYLRQFEPKQMPLFGETKR